MLDRLVSQALHFLHFLHDRRMPRSRANIDHIVITTAGIQRLLVGGRDRSNLVAGMQKRADAVQSAVGVRTSGVLCFVDGKWPLFGGSFQIVGVRIL